MSMRPFQLLPVMWSSGIVGANSGKFFVRTWVTASKPEASLINFGSLNAVPKKLMPRVISNTPSPRAPARSDTPPGS